MDPQTLLNQLYDIQPPLAIEAWPPAIGWWVLSLLTLTSIITGIIIVYRHHQKNSWRRAALKHFALIEKSYSTTPSIQSLTQIITLMKRCVASAEDDRLLLSVSTKDWNQRLRTSGLLQDDEITALSEGHYRKSPPLLTQQSLKHINKWIKAI